MKLNRMFHSVALEQFQPQTRQALSELLDRINSEVMPAAQRAGRTEDFECLTELYLAMPNELLNLVSTRDEGADIRPRLRGHDVKAAWVMDGGNLADVMELMDVHTSELAPSLASDACTKGIHHFVFMIGYVDSTLSLKGASHLMHQLFHYTGLNYKKVRKQGIQIERLSLAGFLKSPSLEIADSAVTAERYFESFYRGKWKAQELPYDTIKTMTKAIYHQYLEEKIECDEPLDYLLRTLVYNPGLRFKARGLSTQAIIDRVQVPLCALTELMLSDRIEGDAQPVLDSFRRQVMVNLFSPFPEDLAYLEVRMAELIGRPGMNNACPALMLPTYKGPLSIFAGIADNKNTAKVAAGMENGGTTIDLCQALTGLLENFEEINELVSYKGTCELLEGYLRNVCWSGPGENDLVKYLYPLTYRMDFSRLPMDSKIGFVGVWLEMAWERLQANLALDINDPDAPVGMLQADPDLRRFMVDWMVMNHRLDARMLHWCGYGGEVLERLGDQANDTLKAELLESDLGL
jgi:hypothetical protein